MHDAAGRLGRRGYTTLRRFASAGASCVIMYACISFSLWHHAVSRMWRDERGELSVDSTVYDFLYFIFTLYPACSWVGRCTVPRFLTLNLSVYSHKQCRCININIFFLKFTNLLNISILQRISRNLMAEFNSAFSRTLRKELKENKC